MENVTDKFKMAISIQTDWQYSGFEAALSALRLNDVNVYFWEGEENWASILLDEDLIGYVWRKYPLVVLAGKHSVDIRSLLSDFEYLIFIDVDSLTQTLLEIDDMDVIESLNCYPLSGVFTMEELWFHTNAI